MAAELESDEGKAWAEVVARWEDDAVHRGFLDRFADLEGLARAGGCYRDVLAVRPDDPVARRWRDEVVRRATAAGLAALPRAAAVVPQVPRWVRPAFLSLLAAVVLGSVLLLFRAMSTWSRP